MTTPTTAETFVDAILDTAPVAGVFANMTQLQDAGRAYQRLQEALTPLTDGKLAFTTAENEQRFHERCAEYLMQPEGNRPPLQQFLTTTLLTEAATPEATRQLAQDLAQMAAGAYAAANLAAPDAPVAWTQKVTPPAGALAEASSVRA